MSAIILLINLSNCPSDLKYSCLRLAAPEPPYIQHQISFQSFCSNTSHDKLLLNFPTLSLLIPHIKQKNPFLILKWGLNSSPDHIPALRMVKGLKRINAWPRFDRKLLNHEEKVNTKKREKK